jgi:hypothetical protein
MTTPVDDDTNLNHDTPPVETALVVSDLAVRRPPAIVLSEAREAAKAVADVIAANPHKVILNGRQYLQFADWQVLARFYGVSAKIVATEYVEMGDTVGFLAKAVAVRADGMEISAAEASCATDEPKWSNKPAYQLRSMAQTRAAAKCLRNVLSFVPILAGFSDTPAEEMIDDGARALAAGSPRRRATKSARPTTWVAALSPEQCDRVRVARESAAWSKGDVTAYVHATYGDEVRALTVAQVDALVAYVGDHPRPATAPDDASMPF